MENVLKGETAKGLTSPELFRDTIRPSGVTCARRKVGAQQPAASTPSRPRDNRRGGTAPGLTRAAGAPAFPFSCPSSHCCSASRRCSPTCPRKPRRRRPFRTTGSASPADLAPDRSYGCCSSPPQALPTHRPTSRPVTASCSGWRPRTPICRVSAADSAPWPRRRRRTRGTTPRPRARACSSTGCAGRGWPTTTPTSTTAIGTPGWSGTSPETLFREKSSCGRERIPTERSM